MKISINKWSNTDRGQFPRKAVNRPRLITTLLAKALSHIALIYSFLDIKILCYIKKDICIYIAKMIISLIRNKLN